jgi:hypothetical protein
VCRARVCSFVCCARVCLFVVRVSVRTATLGIGLCPSCRGRPHPHPAVALHDSAAAASMASARSTAACARPQPTRHPRRAAARSALLHRCRCRNAGGAAARGTTCRLPCCHSLALRPFACVTRARTRGCAWRSKPGWDVQPVGVARGVFGRALDEMGAGLSASEAATLFADLARHRTSLARTHARASCTQA